MWRYILGLAGTRLVYPAGQPRAARAHRHRRQQAGAEVALRAVGVRGRAVDVGELLDLRAEHADLAVERERLVPPRVVAREVDVTPLEGEVAQPGVDPLHAVARARLDDLKVLVAVAADLDREVPNVVSDLVSRGPLCH